MQRFKINPFYGRFDIADEDVGPGGDIEFIAGDAGGSVPPDASKVLYLIGGVGVSTIGIPGTNRITINATGGGFDWEVQTTTPKTIVVHHGYITDTAGLLTFVLPATSIVGDVFEIVGQGAGDWIITHGAGQSIREGNVSSTVGIGGSIASTNRYDSLQCTCVIENTTFQVTKAVGVLKIT